MCIRDSPKVIETPVIAAMAINGIELRAKAKVTVRANIDRLVGGAGEETIIARAVSYTHLDVYKRQVSRRLFPAALANRACLFLPPFIGE